MTIPSNATMILLYLPSRQTWVNPAAVSMIERRYHWDYEKDERTGFRGYDIYLTNTEEPNISTYHDDDNAVIAAWLGDQQYE